MLFVLTVNMLRKNSHLSYLDGLSHAFPYLGCKDQSTLKLMTVTKCVFCNIVHEF